MDKETADSTESNKNIESNEAQCKVIDERDDHLNDSYSRDYEPDTSSKRVDKSKADSSSTILKASPSSSLSSSSSKTLNTSNVHLSSSSSNYPCSSITPPPSPEGKRQKLMSNEASVLNSSETMRNINNSQPTTSNYYEINSNNNKNNSNDDDNNCINNNSNQSSHNIASIAASPPKFVTIEEIFKAANGVSNMYLAHEIAMNKDFRLEKRKSSGLRKDVEIIMKQAFWDILQSQLNESPPVFKQALILLEEIKTELLSFLPMKETNIKKEIEEIIDLELIRQQAENGALDFTRYAQYILSVMARLCAPFRDERIKELTQTNELIPLFSGIMDLLEVMKLDMANFAIEQVRPAILQHSVDYEKEKFKEYLKANSNIGSDCLELTKKWLTNSKEILDLSDEPTLKSKINKILSNSFTRLLTWNIEKDGILPETIMMDHCRIKAIGDQIESIIRVASCLLIINSVFGSMIQDLNQLKERLKDELMILLLYEEDDCKQEYLRTKYENSSEKVIHTINNYITEKNLHMNMNEIKKQQLSKQIVDIENKDNRIRQIVERRILEFIELVLVCNSMASLKIPSGLTAFHNELTLLAGQYVNLYKHNRSVFGEYYDNILTDMLK